MYWVIYVIEKMVSILKKEDFIEISCKVIQLELCTDPFEGINLRGRKSSVHTRICTLFYCALVEARHLENFIARKTADVIDLTIE